jgi:urea transporter/murein DD-endopeptidase MepM/ murein hydrolase activator NlpD
MAVNLIALITGFHKHHITEGLFGFNALLFGMALCTEFEINLVFIIFLFLGCVMLVLITAWLNGIFNKHHLPSLSFPFLIALWICMLASRSLDQLVVRDPGIYIYNLDILHKNNFFFNLTHSCDYLISNEFLSIYWRTLSGTFFQQGVLPGIIISTGLLIYSRIAFSLSFIGLAVAFFYYKLFGGQPTDLSTHLYGSNFIFFAIGAGAFYVIPSRHSYFTVFLLTPVLMFLLLAGNSVASKFGVQAYTLSFSLLMTSLLFALHQRWFHRYLQLVTIQYYSPEKLIYKHSTFQSRFSNAQWKKFSLPFWGNWKVSQGYDGKITHLGSWSKAIDFVIENEEGRTYHKEGLAVEDFYCFGKPVLAACDGYVHSIADGIEENAIGQVNIDRNWGNTVILYHHEGLYTQYSHIKKGSVTVQVGDFVTKGSMLAQTGNSGRSPEPHLHFQVQTTGQIGAPTVSYPFSNFLQRAGGQLTLMSDTVPAEGAEAENINPTELQVASYNLYPGIEMHWKSADAQTLATWTIHTDALNRLYIYCKSSNSFAYFQFDGSVFRFTDFEGDRMSILFAFYQANMRIILGYYPNVKITDVVPISDFRSKPTIFIQDFIAPFKIYLQAGFTTEQIETTNPAQPTEMTLRTKVWFKNMLGKPVDIRYTQELFSGGRRSLEIHQSPLKGKYTCEYIRSYSA